MHNKEISAPTTKTKPQLSVWGWRLLAILGLVIFVANGYWWHQNAPDDARLLLNQRFGLLEKQIDELQKNKDSMQDGLDKLNQFLYQDETDEKFAQLQNQTNLLHAAIDKMRTEHTAGEDRWQLAEIMQLLSIAEQRLYLSGEVELALRALRLADEALRQLASPKLSTTREILYEEIATLARVKEIDTTAVIVDLSDLIETLDYLPILGSIQDATESSPSETDVAAANNLPAWLNNLIADLTSLVQFETSGQPLSPSLSDDLYAATLAKIKLILESAKVAFIQKHEELYIMRLHAAEKIVINNFDTRARATIDWREKLTAAAEVSPNLPQIEIGAARKALREAMREN